MCLIPTINSISSDFNHGCAEYSGLGYVGRADGFAVQGVIDLGSTTTRYGQWQDMRAEQHFGADPISPPVPSVATKKGEATWAW